MPPTENEYKAYDSYKYVFNILLLKYDRPISNLPKLALAQRKANARYLINYFQKAESFTYGSAT